VPQSVKQCVQQCVRQSVRQTRTKTVWSKLTLERDCRTTLGNNVTRAFVCLHHTQCVHKDERLSLQQLMPTHGSMCVDHTQCVLEIR